MNPLLFVFILSCVFGLLCLYIYKRVVKKLTFLKKSKHLFTLSLLLLWGCVPLYALSIFYINFPYFLKYVLALSLGLIFFTFCVAIVYDLLLVSLDASSLRETRRDFFKKTLEISFGVSSSVVSAKAAYNAKEIYVEDVTITLKNLKKSYIVAQISDLHIGGLIDLEYVQECVAKVNATKADIVVITGDLIDTEIEKVDEIVEHLKEIESRLGVYYILGNHEYYHGVKKILKKIKSLGIRVLENENVYIGQEGEGFNLGGVYDVYGYRAKMYLPNIQKALAKRRSDSPTVLLAHQPKFIEELPFSVDLMLSGHTHGGQIFPFNKLVKLQQPYVSGLHRSTLKKHKNRVQIYVNKGTGYWGPPMRLGSSCEITKILLQEG